MFSNAVQTVNHLLTTTRILCTSSIVQNKISAIRRRRKNNVLAKFSNVFRYVGHFRPVESIEITKRNQHANKLSHCHRQIRYDSLVWICVLRFRLFWTSRCWNYRFCVLQNRIYNFFLTKNAFIHAQIIIIKTLYVMVQIYSSPSYKYETKTKICNFYNFSSLVIVIIVLIFIIRSRETRVSVGIVRLFDGRRRSKCIGHNS